MSVLLVLMTNSNIPSSRYNLNRYPSLRQALLAGSLTLAAVVGLAANIVGRSPSQGRRETKSLTTTQVMAEHPKGGVTSFDGNPEDKILLAGGNAYGSTDGGRTWSPLAEPAAVAQNGENQAVSASFVPASDLRPGQDPEAQVTYANSSNDGGTQAVENDTVTIAEYQVERDGSVNLVGGSTGHINLSGSQGRWELDQDGTTYTIYAAKGGGGELEDLGITSSGNDR